MIPRGGKEHSLPEFPEDGACRVFGCTLRHVTHARRIPDTVDINPVLLQVLLRLTKALFGLHAEGQGLVLSGTNEAEREPDYRQARDTSARMNNGQDG